MSRMRETIHAKLQTLMDDGTVRVTVAGAPQWIEGPLKSTRIPVGATAQFKCGTVSYHATSSLPMWMKNGEPLIGCSVKKFWCGDGTRCYDYNKKCDNKNDCPASPGADELNCLALDTCAEGHFSCGGGECKTASKVIRCDGIPQCQNGGDESVKHCGCKVNTDFMCADLEKCISASERCNKHADCADGSDEKRCSYDPEKVIGNKFHFSADLRQLTIPNVQKTDTMCLQCLIHNFREYGPNPKPDITGITFGDACLTVLDPINILSGFPDKQKVQPGDIINFTISAQTDPLEQGSLRYDWYIGGTKYPDNFPLGTWSQIIRLSIGNRYIEIDTSTLKSHDDKLFQALMGNLSVRVYHNFDQKTISTELFTEIIYPPNIGNGNLNEASSTLLVAGVAGCVFIASIVLILITWYRKYKGRPSRRTTTNGEDSVYSDLNRVEPGVYWTIDDEHLYDIHNGIKSNVPREAICPNLSDSNRYVCAKGGCLDGSKTDTDGYLKPVSSIFPNCELERKNGLASGTLTSTDSDCDV